MKLRHRARSLALEVLYEAEIRGETPIEAYEARSRAGWLGAGGDGDDEGDGETGEGPALPEEVLDYARVLVEGVQEHGPAIDALIIAHADHWALERMPVVDRTILRMALFELLYRDDIPVAVGINEAVDLAKSMSTEDSGRFINGLLGRIVEQARPAL